MLARVTLNLWHIPGVIEDLLIPYMTKQDQISVEEILITFKVKPIPTSVGEGITDIQSCSVKTGSARPGSHGL